MVALFFQTLRTYANDAHLNMNFLVDIHVNIYSCNEQSKFPPCM